MNLPEKLVGKVPETINDFLKDLLGPSFKELGLLLGDQIRSLRFYRCIKILEKAKKKITNSDTSINNVNLKFLVPFLEKSTLEEDDTLIDKWAGLLASAATNRKLSYNYINILSELNPTEVTMLEHMYQENKRLGSCFEDWRVQGFEKEWWLKVLKISEEEYELIACNLDRLNLCQSVGSTAETVVSGSRSNKLEPIALRTNRVINLTVFGYDFVKTCHGPEEK